MSPAQGGYRILPDTIARDSLRGLIVDAEAKQPRRLRMIGGLSGIALRAVIEDLQPALAECMRKADPVVPGLQYVVEVETMGVKGVAAGIESVNVQRFIPVPFGEPAKLATTAEA